PTTADTTTPSTPTTTTTTTLPGDCSNPTVIPAQGGTFSGTTSGSSLLAGSCGSSGDSPERVFQWTPAGSGTATIQTCGDGTHFDTVLYLAGGACGHSPEVARHEDTTRRPAGHGGPHPPRRRPRRPPPRCGPPLPARPHRRRLRRGPIQRGSARRPRRPADAAGRPGRPGRGAARGRGARDRRRHPAVRPDLCPVARERGRRAPRVRAGRGHEPLPPVTEERRGIERRDRRQRFVLLSSPHATPAPDWPDRPSPVARPAGEEPAVSSAGDLGVGRDGSRVG